MGKNMEFQYSQKDAATTNISLHLLFIYIHPFIPVDIFQPIISPVSFSKIHLMWI